MSKQTIETTAKYEQLTNQFRVVHVYNQSKVYHLTRQILSDCALTSDCDPTSDCSLTQDNYCFFYHILSKDTNEFNSLYSSFACLIERSSIEADLYLNVDEDALYHIIRYIQTNKINGVDIYTENWKTVDELIDLATMFGMPSLVSEMRALQPPEEHTKSVVDMFRQCFHILRLLYQQYVGSDLDVNIDQVLDDFVSKNKQVIDNVVKNNYHQKNPFGIKFFALIVQTFFIPLFTHYFKSNHSSFDFGEYMNRETNTADPVSPANPESDYERNEEYVPDPSTHYFRGGLDVSSSESESELVN